MAANWKSTLGLSDDQTAQVRSIMTERERQWDADHAKLQAAVPSDRPALRKLQRDHRQSYRDRLHKVLTPEQLKKAQQQFPEMRPMRPNGGNGMHRRMKKGMVPAS